MYLSLIPLLYPNFKVLTCPWDPSHNKQTNKKKNEKLIKAVTELRLCALSGYMPDLLMCPRCGVYEAEEMYFILNGQIFCSNCFEKNPLPQGTKISKSLALALRHLVFAEDKKLFSFSLSEKSLERLSDITEEYLSRKVERNFATLQFYKTVSS